MLNKLLVFFPSVGYFYKLSNIRSLYFFCSPPPALGQEIIEMNEPSSRVDVAGVCVVRGDWVREDDPGHAVHPRPRYSVRSISSSNPPPPPMTLLG